MGLETLRITDEEFWLTAGAMVLSTGFDERHPPVWGRAGKSGETPALVVLRQKSGLRLAAN